MQITVPKLEQNEIYRQMMLTFNEIITSEIKVQTEKPGVVSHQVSHAIADSATARMKDYFINLKVRNVIEFCPNFRVIVMHQPNQMGGYTDNYLLRCDSMELCKCLKIELPQATYHESYQPFFN